MSSGRSRPRSRPLTRSTLAPTSSRSARASSLPTRARTASARLQPASSPTSPTFPTIRTSASPSVRWGWTTSSTSSTRPHPARRRGSEPLQRGHRTSLRPARAHLLRCRAHHPARALPLPALGAPCPMMPGAPSLCTPVPEKLGRDNYLWRGGGLGNEFRGGFARARKST